LQLKKHEGVYLLSEWDEQPNVTKIFPITTFDMLQTLLNIYLIGQELYVLLVKAVNNNVNTNSAILSNKLLTGTMRSGYSAAMFCLSHMKSL
jgi:hypothetical protein